MRFAVPPLLASLAACTPTPAPVPTPEPVTAPAPQSANGEAQPTEREARAAYWVRRTDAELDSAFEDVCSRAKTSKKPVLISFSAEWCIDCKRVYALSKEEPLKSELAQWETLVVNPGQFDRHRPVLGAFEVSRLVTWVATQPQDCRLPAPSWERLRQQAFEPASGEPWTGEQLAVWLRDARRG